MKDAVDEEFGRKHTPIVSLCLIVYCFCVRGGNLLQRLVVKIETTVFKTQSETVDLAAHNLIYLCVICLILTVCAQADIGRMRPGLGLFDMKVSCLSHVFCTECKV